MCIPLEDEQDLLSDDGVDLAGLAELLTRPLALDPEERVAYLGEAARDQSAQLMSLRAPDFSLPDLDGKLHSLSDQRGRKVLLVAYASW
ncbi:MAG: redoxin domain-containing protein [Myxococcales bacterium]|nr:redoxin domain-containing protein [Myxococcales bacterium]TDI95306.1 MAG: redoxin domain-containing protein [Deltaproteobacteria bacterium]TDJ08082.1 MAG: redoxin domain-containing protein [Deltaproteobacteria bacterium]